MVKIIKKKILRKEGSFSNKKVLETNDAKTLFFAPMHASLTVEAALILPLFLFCMVAALQYCRVMETAVQFGTAMSETGKELATAAYVTTWSGDGGTEEASYAASIFSLVYAQSAVTGKADDTSGVKNVNMALSSLMQEDEMIDLVLTYQIRTPVSAVSLPGTFFIQRASVRAWVGRTDEDEEGESETGEEDSYVYITETGTVYHLSSECSYLKLSVFTIAADTLSSLRNESGGKYYACELCGAEAGPVVYATMDGTRYHSTLSCSALKRTVTQVKLSEVGDRHACSRCG